MRFVYVGLTALAAVLMAAGDLDVYQAVVHAMTTTATGGFSTQATSVASFSTYTQWVITVFMFLAGVNFALHYKALRHPSVYARDSEFRLYTALIVAGIVLVAGGLMADNELAGAIRTPSSPWCLSSRPPVSPPPTGARGARLCRSS